MRGGRIMTADRSFPSTQICWCCDAQSGPNGREELQVERWGCSERGAGYDDDANAAINRRKLAPGVAEARRR
jgi:transposase